MSDAPAIPESAESVDAGALARRIRAGEPTTILDVRDRDEFEAWHVDGSPVDAVQVPYQRFIAARVQGTTAEVELGADPGGDDDADSRTVADLGEPVVAVCAVGNSSADVAADLRDVGIEAVNLAGGMEAWADVYEAVELPCSGATVLQYQRPATGCLAYLVVAGDEAAVVDPLRAFADRYAEDAAERGADLTVALDTHVHADHVSGLRAVGDSTDAETVLPAGAADRGLAFDPDRLVDDGDGVAVGDATLTAMHVPGHTSEMTTYRLADPEGGDLLLGGDLLFLDAVARPDLEVGDDGAPEMARTLYDTLHSRVLDLPEPTRVAPGHFGTRTRPDDAGVYVATVGALRERLDLLSLDADAFVGRVTGSMPAQPNEFERIIAVNLGRTDLDGEDAADVELGPNNCAAG